MKLDPAISAKLAVLQPNQIGLLAWSLLAHPLPIRPAACRTSLTPTRRNRQNPASIHRWSRASRPCLTSRLPPRGLIVAQRPDALGASQEDAAGAQASSSRR
jgi:hypothetical protein